MAKSDDIKNIAIVVGVLSVLGYLKAQFTEPQLDVDENNLSFTPEWYITTCEALEMAFWFSWQIPLPFMDTESSQVIVELMTEAQTTDDVNELFNVYGVRCRPLPDVICAPESLFASIVDRLAQEWIDVINSDYSAKGILWQF